MADMCGESNNVVIKIWVRIPKNENTKSFLTNVLRAESKFLREKPNQKQSAELVSHEIKKTN